MRLAVQAQGRGFGPVTRRLDICQVGGGVEWVGERSNELSGNGFDQVVAL